MKENVARISAFVSIVVLINILAFFVTKSRQQSFINSLGKIQMLTGTITLKDSLQQNVGLLGLQLDQNDIKDFDLSGEGFIHLTTKGNRAELVVSHIDNFEVGDSLLIDASRKLCINYRRGHKMNEIDLKDLFVYRRTPVYYEAKRKKTLAPEGA